MALLGPFGYSGGLHTGISNFTAKEDQNTVFSDVFLSYGNVKNVQGNTAIGPAQSCLGISCIYNTSSPYQPTYLVIVATNSIKTASWTLDSTSLSFTERGSAVTVSGVFRTFDFLNGINVMVGGSGLSDVPIQLFTTSNASNLAGSPPGGDAVKTVNNFMFIGANLSTNVSRVYWSNVGDPTTWGASNFVDFRKNDGDFVTALGSLAQDLIIFKLNSIGRLYTNPPSSAASVTLGPLITLSTSVGCVGPRAVDNLPDGTLVFLASNFHVYKYDGVTFTDLSDQPYPGPSVQSSLNNASGAVPQTARSFIVKTYPTRNEVWVVVTHLASSSGNGGDTTFVYNYVDNVWHIKSTSTIGSLAVINFNRSGAAIGYPYRLISDSSGTVSEEDSELATYAAVGGSPIVTNVTKSFVFDAETSDFIPRSILIPMSATGGSGNTNITLGFDGTLNGSATYSVTAGPNPTRVVIPVAEHYGNQRNFSLQVQIKIDTTPFTLYPMWLSDEVIT